MILSAPSFSNPTTAMVIGVLLATSCVLPAHGQVNFDFDQELVGENSDDLFGWSLDLSGDGKTLIVGAIDNDGAPVGPEPGGHARVYRNTFNATFNTWSWVQLGADIDGAVANEESGYDVAVTNSGNTVAVGVPNRDRAMVYDLTIQDTWAQRGNGFRIYTSETAQRAGHAVSLSGDGNILVMGAPTASKVWWADISAGSGMPLISGLPLQMTGTFAGGALDLNEDGTRMVVGAYKTDTNRGQVVVYERTGNDWAQLGQTLSGENTNDQFGYSVSISADGNSIAVGSKGWDTSTSGGSLEVGQVVVYDRDGSAWVQRGSPIQGANVFDQCGYAVGLSGDGSRIVVGYRGNSAAFQSAGQVRVFDWDGNDWAQNGDPILGNESYAYAGHSVGISDDGTVLAIGASQDSGPLNQFSSDEGTVRVYEGNCFGASSTQAVQSCAPYEWIDGVTYTESNNTALVVLEDAAGCDSIVRLDLTITEVDASITQDDELLSANNANASYQWIDCTNDNEPIDGATEQSYTVVANGSYAVEVTAQGCTVLSECLAVVVQSTAARSAERFVLYPNPVTDRIHVRSDLPVAQLDLFDMTGKYLIGNTKQTSLALGHLVPGAYCLRVTLPNNEVTYSRIFKR